MIISGWYHYKLIFFLQKRNPNIPAIPFKLEAPQKRSLSNAKSFWSEIIKLKPISDIYTNRLITLDDLSIDHFIPWSFVLHDRLWNLVPTSKAVNSSKNDRLPQLELYLDKFCGLQYFALRIALGHNLSRKLLDDYTDISRDNALSRNIKKDTFIRNLKESLIPLYQLAQNQGYLVWSIQVE